MAYVDPFAEFDGVDDDEEEKKKKKPFSTVLLPEEEAPGADDLDPFAAFDRSETAKASGPRETPLPPPPSQNLERRVRERAMPGQQPSQPGGLEAELPRDQDGNFDFASIFAKHPQQELKTKTTKRGVASQLKETIGALGETVLSGPAADVASGAAAGAAGTAQKAGWLVENVLNAVEYPARKIEEAIRGKKVKGFGTGTREAFAQFGATKLNEFAHEMNDRGIEEGVIKSVLQGVGSAAADLPVLAATGNVLGMWNLAAHGFVGAMDRSNNDLAAGGKGALGGAVMHGVMGAANKVFGKMVPVEGLMREAAMRLGGGIGMAGGGVVAGKIEGEDTPLNWKDITANVLLGAGMTKPTKGRAKVPKGQKGEAAGGAELKGSTEFYRQFFNKNAPIENIAKEVEAKTGKKLPEGQNPKYQSRSELGMASKAYAAYHELSGFNADGSRKIYGEGPKPVYKRASAELKEAGVKTSESRQTLMDLYLKNRRIVSDLYPNGKATEQQALAAQSKLTAIRHNMPEVIPIVEKFAADIGKITKNMLQMQKDAGLISQERVDQIVAKNKSYIPFHEVAEEVGWFPKEKGRSGKPKRFGKLGEKEVQSPTKALAEDIINTIRPIERNKTISSAVKALEMGFPGEAVEVKKKPIVTKKTTKSGKEVVTVTKSSDLRPGEVEFYENGKRKVYKLKNEGLAKSLTDFTSGETHWMWKVFQAPAKALRAGVTLDPIFNFYNIQRDLVHASVQSKFNPKHFGRAMYHQFKKSPEYLEYLASAGGSGIRGADVKTTQADVNQWFGSKKHLLKHLMPGYTVYKTLDTVGKGVENLPRFGAFLAEKAAGASPMKAGFAGRESTTDFAVHGASQTAQTILKTIPFANPALQGFDRTRRAFRDNPAETSMKTALYVAAPAIVMAALNHDDEELEEIHPQVKSRYTIVPRKYTRRLGLGESMLFVAKPQGVLGAVSYATELAYKSLIKNDPAKAKEVFTAAANAFSPVGEDVLTSIMPAFMKVPVELAADYNFFYGRPIIPESRKDALPQEQHSRYTPGVLVKAGKVLGMSSSQLEYVVGNVFGSLGRHGTKAIDELDKWREAKSQGKDYRPPKLDNMPFVSRLIRKRPFEFPKSKAELYQKRRELRGVKKSISIAERDEDWDRLRELEVSPLLDYEKDLEGVAEIVRDIDEQIAEIQKSRVLSPEAITEKVNKLYDEQMAMIKFTLDSLKGQ